MDVHELVLREGAAARGCTDQTASPPSRAAVWLTPLRPAAEPRLRLVMVPHAGGAPSSLRGLAARIDAGIDVVAVHLPGREKRFPDQSTPTIHEMARAVGEALRELPDLPYALFGHSMGGLLAYEIARMRIGAAAPVHVVVSAIGAPDVARLPRRHTWSDARLRDWMLDLGGVAPAIAADEQLVGVLLAVLRVDLRACEIYRYHPGPPLASPLTVFGAREDPLVSAEELAAWAGHAGGTVDVQLFDGGHFYLMNEESDVAARLSALLSKSMSGGDAR
jgi:surfactin synthase thioesterase subunit